MREFSLIMRSRIAILLRNSRCFWGYVVFLRKFYLGFLEFSPRNSSFSIGILKFPQAKMLNLEFLRKLR